MRKITLTLMMLMLLCTSALFAQGRGQGQNMDPEEMVAARADLWQEEFGLSDEQHSKVKEILLKNLEESRERIAELRGSSDREAMRKAVEDMRADLDKQLKNIFNEKQWAAYEQWKKDNPAIQRRRRGGGQA